MYRLLAGGSARSEIHPHTLPADITCDMRNIISNTVLSSQSSSTSGSAVVLHLRGNMRRNEVYFRKCDTEHAVQSHIFSTFFRSLPTSLQAEITHRLECLSAVNQLKTAFLRASTVSRVGKGTTQVNILHTNSIIHIPNANARIAENSIRSHFTGPAVAIAAKYFLLHAIITPQKIAQSDATSLLLIPCRELVLKPETIFTHEQRPSSVDDTFSDAFTITYVQPLTNQPTYSTTVTNCAYHTASCNV